MYILVVFRDSCRYNFSPGPLGKTIKSNFIILGYHVVVQFRKFMVLRPVGTRWSDGLVECYAIVYDCTQSFVSRINKLLDIKKDRMS